MIKKIKYLKRPQVKKTIEPKFKITEVIIVLLLIYSSLFHKGLFLVLLFQILSYAKNTIKFRIRWVPLDINLVFGVTAAYYYSPLFSIIILILAAVHRFMFGFFERRYLFDTTLMLVIFLLIPYFRGIAFLPLAFVIVVINYTVLIFLDIENIEALPYWLLKTATSFILFYFVKRTGFFG